MRAGNGARRPPRIVIGLVGYYPFVRGLPIGPELKEGLQDLPWPGCEVEIKEMNWGPIAIVQDFQATRNPAERVVLAAAVDRGLAEGTVSCRRWMGGELDALALQHRVFEAVTGVISLDNLLVIGEHFGIWPREVITVEAQFDENAFGNLVLSELHAGRQGKSSAVVGGTPMTPEKRRIMQRMLALLHRAATKGEAGLPELRSLSMDRLTTPARVCHNRFVGALH